MSRIGFEFTGTPADAADENAVLRAALAEAQQRIRDLEANPDMDGVTPLPGVRRFRAELERVVGLSERHGTPGAVVDIALTGLEAVGQQHGHFAVDAALVHVARLVCGLIRSTDVLARTGEAEFGLILDHLDHNSAIDAGERLARCIADHPLDLGHVKVSLGAAVATTSILPGDSAENVLERARSNLERAKSEL